MLGIDLSTALGLALIPTLGVTELLVILLIVVLIFGASKLPQLGRGLGEGIRNFKKGVRDDDDRIDEGTPTGGDPRP